MCIFVCPFLLSCLSNYDGSLLLPCSLESFFKERVLLLHTDLFETVVGSRLNTQNQTHGCMGKQAAPLADCP